MRILKRRQCQTPEGKTSYWCQYVGTSNEAKPLDCAGGSIFTEVDHSDGAVKFVYDESSKSWN